MRPDVSVFPKELLDTDIELFMKECRLTGWEPVKLLSVHILVVGESDGVRWHWNAIYKHQWGGLWRLRSVNDFRSWPVSVWSSDEPTS